MSLEETQNKLQANLTFSNHEEVREGGSKRVEIKQQIDEILSDDSVNKRIESVSFLEGLFKRD